MQTLRRTVAVLIFPAIAWLGAACERTDTPTEIRPTASLTGPTCFVPGDYATIQAAVNFPGCTTIIVAPGTYNEAVTIGRPLTLLGPNANISWNGTRVAEATVNSGATTFNVTSQDVTIAGFTITGDFGIHVSVSTTNTAIENNIITGTSRALSLEPSGSNTSVLGNHLISITRSMHLSGSGPYSNLQVNGNRFSGTLSGPGIFFLANIPITGFEFKDNEVFVYANIASDIGNGTVSGNTFDAPAGPFVLDLQILLQNSTMTDNVFEGNDMTACLQLFGTQFSPGDPSHHVSISDNTFSDCGGLAPPFNYAIQLSQDVHHIDINNNEISDGNEGVNTRDAPPPWTVAGLEIHINFNNITNNTTFGVRNGQMGILDAECNWWGDESGPGLFGTGSGDNVSMNVDFTPWLTSPAPGGKCIGGLLPSGGQVTGGGQVSVNVTGGTGSFGFSANAARQSGHLNYMNHATRAHLNCTVNVVTILPNNMAHLEGICANSDAPSFKADVQDNGTPGKNKDTFKITYTDQFGLHMDEGGPGPIISGNIEIH
jgi:hypothetical protein